MLARVVLWQFSESDTGDDVDCTCDDLWYNSHEEVYRNASVKIAEMLVLGKIHNQAVGEPDSDEWRCHGDRVEKSSFSRFHIYDLCHEHDKDDEHNDKDGREEGNCGFALWVQNEGGFRFAGFDSAIDTKTHPSKTEDAYALENRPWYWAGNEVVSVVHVRTDSALCRGETHTL